MLQTHITINKKYEIEQINIKNIIFRYILSCLGAPSDVTYKYFRDTGMEYPAKP